MPEPLLSGNQQATARPFPWICPKCRKKEVRPAAISYQAERLHKGKLAAVTIPHLTVPKCANCGELVFNYAADEQIIAAIHAHVAGISSETKRTSQDNIPC